MDRKNALIAAVSAATFVSAAAPALAQMENQRESNRNLRTVRHSLDDLISQLQQDRADYGGHRANAINALTRARNELMAAEQFSRQHG